MSLELPRDTRQQAIQSLDRYFEDELGQRIGNIQAGALLNFFLQEIAPSVYNQAIRDAQERLLMRVQELDIECHEEEFAYGRAQRTATTPKKRSPRP